MVLTFTEYRVCPRPCAGLSPVCPFFCTMSLMQDRHLLLAVANLAANSFGQSGKAELFGTIFDPSGAAIPKAQLEAVDQATAARFAATSGDRGAYHLLGLPAGKYTVRVQAPRFSEFRQTDFTLRLGDQTELNVTLTLGGDRVDVNVDASLLQTASGAVNYSVDQTKVATLPLDGRNFIPLIALSPGVALPGGGSLLPRINGSRPRTNEYIYDGISVLQPEPGQPAFYPVLDAVAEFRLNINSYSPEYGRSNGGTVLVMGKSGGNALHGTLFEFFRNEDLNARNYFAPAGAKPEFRRNQYGFVLGGPLQKNRTFFFMDWQGSRLRTGVTRISTVPTPAQRNGVFAAPIYDPATAPRQPFPNNTLPAYRFDPVALQVLGHYPLPTSSAAANNYTRTAVEPDDQDQFDARLDRYFGTRHRVFGRYSFWRDDDTPVTPLPDGSGALTSGVIGHAIARGDGWVAEHDWTPAPNLLNTARFGYTRRDLKQRSLQSGSIGVPGVPANSFASVLPTFAVTGYQQVGPASSANSNFTTSVAEYTDTFSMVRGRHTIKFGTDLRREALDNLTPPNPTGAYAFDKTGTNATGAASSGN